MKLLLFLIFLCSLTSFCQSGKVTVRKTEQNLIGKTLLLNDLRGAKAGNINFNSKNKATLTLEIEIKNPIIKSNFGNEIPLKETLSCSYSIINDTLLLLKHNNYQDTCYYNYINETNNLVQFKNTLHGIIENDFSVFYHLDSILLSSSFYKFQSDSLFSQNIEIDSIYKNVQDKKLKKELENKLKEELVNYNEKLAYNYFKGEYKLSQNNIKLISNNTEFAQISLKQDTLNQYYITVKYTLDGNLNISSDYGHQGGGKIILKYDSAYITYNLPSIDYSIPFYTESFKIKHIKYDSAMLYNKNDTIRISKYNNAAQIKNTVGGYFDTYIKSLNDKKHTFKKLYFTHKGIYELEDNNTITNYTKAWDYKLTDSALYVFNARDTLVDELSVFFNRISFTYRNNEALVFGVYHTKINNGKHEFLILFEDNTGIKFTSNTFDYKIAREILKTKKQKPTKHSSYKFYILSFKRFSLD